jgi:capsule polysaccharide export protein KpsE/RkpR
VKGDTEQSVEDLQEAVLAPTAAKYLHLAEAQLASQQVAAARRSLEQAKQLGLEPERLSRADRARLEQIEAALASPVGA